MDASIDINETTANYYDVYPVSDLIEHETGTGSCKCGPKTKNVEGKDAKLVIHNAADGRE